MTQKQKIINLLEAEEWVCTSKMYAQYMADPRTILSKMKKDGLVINRWCATHNHEGKMKEWSLVQRQFCCSDMRAFGQHFGQCKNQPQIEDKGLF